jgi:Na+/proline symporter
MALLIVFFAVTSSLSAEMVAVSSVMTYDVYQTYIDPKATNKEIKRVQSTMIVSYGLFAGVLAIVLNNIGITIGYLYLLMVKKNIYICIYIHIYMYRYIHM